MTLEKLEAFLIVKQKVHEVDKLTIEDDDVPLGTEAKDSPDLELPDKNLVVKKARLSGGTPQKYIKIKAKEIEDKSSKTMSGEGYVYNPRTKTYYKKVLGKS